MQVVSQQEKFQHLNTVVISFGQPQFAKGWIEYTSCPFLILLDPERDSYGLYGLERSWLRAYSPANLWGYVKRWWQGDEKGHESHGEDTAQMGGNFIVGTDGKIQFAHYCKDPTDRPSIEKLLSVK